MLKGKCSEILTVNVSKTCKVYLVIIMSKDLLTHVLFLSPLETILMLMLKNTVRNSLRKSEKNKNHAQVKFPQV